MSNVASAFGMEHEERDSGARVRGSWRTRRLRVTRSEARRLRRPSFAGVGFALLVFFAAMTASVTFLAGGQIGPGGAFGTQIDLASPEGIVAGLATGADIFGIVVLALWATAAASDYSTGWVRIIVQAEPRRGRLFAGKLLALTAYTVIGTAAVGTVSVGSAPILARAAGVSTAAWSTGIVGTILSAWVNVTMAVLVWGVIGVAIATVTRSATAAVAGGIGYMMVVEGLLGMVLDTQITTYLPGSVLNALASGGTAALAYGAAILLASLYALAALAIAAGTFRRRDITS